MKNLEITCPQCGHQFSPEAAVEGHLRAHLEKEYALKMEANSKLVEERVKSKVNALEKESFEKSKKLQQLEMEKISLTQREKDLNEREERAELELKRKLLAGEEKIRLEAEASAREKAEVEFMEKEASLRRQQEAMELSIKKTSNENVEKVREEGFLKLAELQKKLDDQSKLVEEMSRKSGQGSMQVQGEVQELAIL